MVVKIEIHRSDLYEITTIPNYRAFCIVSIFIGWFKVVPANWMSIKYTSLHLNMHYRDVTTSLSASSLISFPLHNSTKFLKLSFHNYNTISSHVPKFQSIINHNHFIHPYDTISTVTDFQHRSNLEISRYIWECIERKIKI
ncbi:hypothetical protein EYC80_009491 [Monilinia laxa]|uniref:Uncharacterized protein n=1 Tax=Monilinia laxa TaxID=61186 RepID=A0A5N6JY01_MONLA|nr:hypothetical protein EYC80_009491 [Monilinia laxa]